MQPKNIGKAVLAYVVLHVLHQMFNDEVDKLARQHGWRPVEVEAAKAAGSIAFALI